MTHAVVIGAGQGGLTAAIYLALQGKKVLVLERGEQAGGKAGAVSAAGFRFDPGPSIIILTRIYERVFRDAGRRMEDYLAFTPLDPFTRVVMEGRAPLDLPAGYESCRRALADAVPEDVAAVDALMAKLDRVMPHIDASIFAHPIDQPWQLMNRHLVATGLQFDVRATYRQLVDRMFTSPMLRAFFYGFPSYGGQSYDSKAPGALLIPYLMLRDGVHYPVGGVAAIPRAFERLARELGVEFRFGAKVERLETDGRRVKSVVLEGGERADADQVVSNVDRLHTGSWLGRSVDMAPSFSYFTLQWGLKRAPEGLRHHTLLIPTDFEKGFEDLYRRRAFPTPPIVYLNETHTVDPECAPPGMANLFAVITAPAQEPHIDWAAETPVYRQEVLRQMAKAGYEIAEDEIVVERIQTPNYFAEAHGNYRGSLYGPDERHRLFGGLLPLRNWDEEFRNLFYAGGSVQPGAGLPMVTLSGRFAAMAAR